MAAMAIAHRPDLTIEQVEETFRRRFEPKYKVEAVKSNLARPRFFRVVENPFVAVSVKLNQSDRETKFVYGGCPGRWWAGALVTMPCALVTFGLGLGVVGGLVGGGLGGGLGVVAAMPIWSLLWKGLTNEVVELIRTAPEFK